MFSVREIRLSNKELTNPQMYKTMRPLIQLYHTELLDAEKYKQQPEQTNKQSFHSSLKLDRLLVNKL